MLSPSHPLILLDVGCKGGMHPLAQQATPHVIAHGFEVIGDEVARLKAAATAGMHYHHIKCVGPDGDMGGAVINSNFFDRTTAHQVSTKMGIYAASSGEDAPPEQTLDQFVSEQNLAYVDFIKTDTDGYDFSILKGAEKILCRSVLGLQVECAINGGQSDQANLFRNVDRYLQGMGFSLFDMRLFRYSRAAMPLPFETPDPAQTVAGQVSWCDAFYFRDLCRADYENHYGFKAEPHQILKLAALFEYYQLPDCAAELLLRYKTMIDDADARIEPLVPQSMGKLSYGEYMATFNHMMGMGKIYPFGRIKLR